MPPRIWNSRRQWLGNIIPFALAVVVGVALISLGTYVAFIGAILAGWFGVSHWGFFENRRIDTELRAKSGSEGELIGFVYRVPPTALDAHAEIGLLLVKVGCLEFRTEAGAYTVEMTEIKKISRQFNIHSLLGLGGWIVLSRLDGSELKLESRKYNNMLRSRIRSKELYRELTNWKNEKAPASRGPFSN